MIKYKMSAFEEDDFDGLKFEAETLGEGQMLDGKLFSCSMFTCCDFSNSEIRNCTFRNCQFVNCNMSLTKFNGTRMDGVQFLDCQLMGIDWTVMLWPRRVTRKRHAFGVFFERCVLNYSIFIGLDMYQASFKGCSLKEVGFEDADMEEAVFDDADLMMATFRNTNLSGADLSSASNYNINVMANRLKKTKFSLPEAISLLYAMDVEIIHNS